MKLLALSLITVMVLLIFACGEEEAPEPTPTSTPDRAATAEANAQATAEADAVIAASVRATLEALPTDTPAPTNTPTPTSTPTPTRTPTPTHTPTPTTTPTPTPTSTPEPTSTSTPTHTPEPTSTPTSAPTVTPQPTATNTPTPTNTLTPIPVGDRPERAFAFQQWGFIGNTEPKLRLRVQLVLWGRTAEEDIQDYNERFNIRAPVGYSFVLVRMQITNDGDKPGTYDALSRLRLVSALPEKEFSYGLGNGLLCDEIRRPFTDGHVIDIDHNKSDEIDHTEQGHVCFLVKSEDAGDAILLDNGGADGSREDWRYWKLRGTN